MEYKTEPSTHLFMSLINNLFAFLHQDYVRQDTCLYFVDFIYQLL